ncbi:MAG TPA: ubiquinol-cytochrome c reductase iron-sulfur subunit [Gemmataceae bacterium]|jgi:Rieske Fe-S protein|nr:ubiquinol-cytochrome c reductase iron-sulfur subunit [Gemmataceae bacterium]
MTTEPNTDPAESRRSFLKFATNALGALFALVLGVPAVAYLIDARNRAAAQGDFKTVARLSELPVNVPQQVVIRDVRRDAWTIHPNDVIGRVWLIRRDKDQVEAFTTICPHLGCSVNFEETAHLFVCPCHGGTFDFEGHRKDLPGQINPAPRGMDRLECRRSPANPDLIEVKYQNFMQGKDVQVPKT